MAAEGRGTRKRRLRAEKAKAKWAWADATIGVARWSKDPLAVERNALARKAKSLAERGPACRKMRHNWSVDDEKREQARLQEIADLRARVLELGGTPADYLPDSRFVQFASAGLPTLGKRR